MCPNQQPANVTPACLVPQAGWPRTVTSVTKLMLSIDIIGILLHASLMTTPYYLVARLHVDLCQQSSALCRVPTASRLDG
jgi:hypothetical protein